MTILLRNEIVQMFLKIIAPVGPFVTLYKPAKKLVTFIYNKTSKFKLGLDPMNLKSYSKIPNTIPRILMNQLKDKNKDTHVYYTESHNSKWLKTITQKEKHTHTHTFHSETTITHQKEDNNKSSRSTTWDQQLLVKEN